MATYRRMAAAKVAALRERFPNADEMCKTCAFRMGSEASATQQVLEMIEDCLLTNGVFNCHDGGVVDRDGFLRFPPGHEQLPCVGYMRLISTVPA